VKLFRVFNLEDSCFNCKHAATRVTNEIEYCMKYKEVMENEKPKIKGCAKIVKLDKDLVLRDKLWVVKQKGD